MALINCPECELEVSDKAEKCPKCAYPLNTIPTNQPQVKQEIVVHTKIIEMISPASKLTLYSDYLEGEFFRGGVTLYGGNFIYKLYYNEINSVNIEKVGKTCYLIIDYPNKPIVDQLHKLPSNNNFEPSKNNIVQIGRAHV